MPKGQYVMAEKESNEYILGTHKAELHRLGIQHQVWASEASRGWQDAGFTSGDTILDLGSGPGFCSTELAFITGESGEVHAMDKSAAFIAFLNEVTKTHGLNIKGICTDFDAMELENDFYDGIYSRWALAWVPNPEEIVRKLFKSLKTGGKIVIHEYFDWTTLQSEPKLKGLEAGIKAAHQSFIEMPGDISIGRKLPAIFEQNGFTVDSMRPMSKLARPQDLAWHWPKSFFNIYFPALVEMGYLTSDGSEQALSDFNNLEGMDGATILCPMMTEVIATKL
ncbi:MAG: ubiquinone/menaquinone biosynthesis C-methylase UbiE [Patiriisocius sp.]|jgi:ubiquinone/menaquinone biosynthesis C-methylase UbiE